MDWVDAISKPIQYIEEHITEELTADRISEHINISSFYFQKGFAMLCGFTITEYIRNRRLALAGNDLATGDEKIIDIAMKYGYDSPDSSTQGGRLTLAILSAVAEIERENITAQFLLGKMQKLKEGG